MTKTHPESGRLLCYYLLDCEIAGAAFGILRRFQIRYFNAWLTFGFFCHADLLAGVWRMNDLERIDRVSTWFCGVPAKHRPNVTERYCVSTTR
jgi:hypothetical protein